MTTDDEVGTKLALRKFGVLQGGIRVGRLIRFEKQLGREDRHELIVVEVAKLSKNVEKAGEGRERNAVF